MNGKNQRLGVARKRLIINLGIVLGILISGMMVYAQNCKYNKNSIRQIENYHILREENLGEVKNIRGIVLTSVDDVFPGVAIVLYRIESEKRVYIGSQSSDANGNFCFRGQKKGRYELHMGQVLGFDKKIFYLQLNPKNKKLSNTIKAYMEVGI